MPAKRKITPEMLEGIDLNEISNKLQLQDELLKKLTALPNLYGTVLKVYKDRIVAVVDRRIYEVEYPHDTMIKRIKVGDAVRLHPETMQITGVTETLPFGSTAMVTEVKGDLAEVNWKGENKAVLNRFTDLRPGDKVIVDDEGVTIVDKIGQKDKKFSLTEDTNVSWNDIGGLERAKEVMREAIEMPFKYAELYRKFGKYPVKGILLYGPPGCGKTLVGKATATEMAKLHGKKSGGFLYVKGPEMLSMWVGNTEAAIREVFLRAKRHQEDLGYPPVIFIDEADSMLNKRGSGVSSDVDRTIVPAFLAEMDGMGQSGALVLLATNRSDMLDPAVTRDGRIDRRVHIGRPDAAQTLVIFGIYLKRLPMSADNLPELATEELFSNNYPLAMLECVDGDGRRFDIDVPMHHVVSGAMVNGIVDRATTIAIKRVINNSKTAECLNVEDINKAIAEEYTESRDMDFTADLDAAVKVIERKYKVVNVLRGGQVGTKAKTA